MTSPSWARSCTVPQKENAYRDRPRLDGHQSTLTLKQHGRSKILNPTDWPSFVQTVRPIYEDVELTKLFKACTPAEEGRFKFYLMSGFRDAEGRFVTWRDIDFKHSAVRVTAKPHWGFQPKNWEEREVPVPQKLITMLQKFRPTNATPDDP